MNRDLLTWRDHSRPCEHELGDMGGVHQPGEHHEDDGSWCCRFTDDCPGGARLFTECEECEGSGQEWVGPTPVMWGDGASSDEYAPCPACHGLGIVPVRGDLALDDRIGWVWIVPIGEES